MHVRGRAATITLAALAAASVTAAGAAGIHRFTVTQSANGSGGATAFLNTSASSSALQGEVGSSVNSSIRIPFGVLGEYDAPGSTFGIGVAGISSTGYAVGGEVFGGSPAIIGINAADGDGLDALARGEGNGITAVASADGSGIVAMSPSDGVEAVSTGGGDAVSALSATGDGIIAGSEEAKGGSASIGLPSGTGVAVYGFSGTSSDPALAVNGVESDTDAIATYNQSGVETFVVQAGSQNRRQVVLDNVADVQVSGDLYVHGLIYEDCSAFPATASTDCYDVSHDSAYTTQGVTRTSRGTDVKTYGVHESLPTVEDFGRAQLANGATYVRLDPAFAQTISPSEPYLVFVTPSGESRGLYVDHRTLQGFEVHENAGGRATIGFDYRIVASPLGDRPARFAAVPPHQTRVTSTAPAPGKLAEYAAIRKFKLARPHAMNPVHDLATAAVHKG